MSSSTPALTTIFTTPQACFSRLYTVNGNIPDQSSILDWDVDDIATTCYPQENGLVMEGYFVSWVDVYSPGVCPKDHTVFATTVSTDGETMAYCCPTGFWGTSGEIACFSSFMTPTIAVLVTDIPQGTDSTPTIAGTTSLTPNRNSPLIAERSLLCVAWKSSDLGLFTPASAPLLNLNSDISSIPGPWWERTSTIPQTQSTTTLATTIPSGIRIAPSTTISGHSVLPSIATPLSGTNQGKLTSSQRIGIEVGAVLGFIAVGIGCAWLFLRRRLAKKERRTRV